MTDEEFNKAIQEHIEMLNALHRIRDKSRTRWLKREIREHLIAILKEH